uniref:25.3 kDa vesicle transport protein n=1 Tax=Erigeron canadensis TaxID=72917 RepID=UPI001CB9B7F6|nr:25.3 kDa vesicle transport protein [Erigeron canadensis]
MVKLTIVGRISDGLPISQQGPDHINQVVDDDIITNFRKHAELLLHEISIAALPPSSATIFIHPHCFYYMVRNGICFITLCEESYPRKLAFHYLQDLQKEFGDKIHDHHPELVNQITKPYSFVKFDNIIRNVRRQYVDTRTQANLSKLLSCNHTQEFEDVHTEQMSLVIERRRRSDIMMRMMTAHKSTSPVWGSKTLEVIAVKWTPITIIFVVVFVLLWSILLRARDRMY